MLIGLSPTNYPMRFCHRIIGEVPYIIVGHSLLSYSGMLYEGKARRVEAPGLCSVVNYRASLAHGREAGSKPGVYSASLVLP